MTETDYAAAISPIEEIIEEARNGRMYILVDHEDRENEGDLVIPAQMCTPDAINFMATYGRGLICLTLTSERIDALGLPLMAATNSSRHETAFTVSIEAREGVSTGISAGDRARTVAAAINPKSTAADIATPGHIFPLRARDGGVLVRAGHTEASVDVSRLAGLDASGVICEIMKDDGTMARLPDLVAFAQHHNLKIGTISDLIAYRRRHDHLVRQTGESKITTAIGGEWDLKVFRNGDDPSEHMALTKGDVSDGKPVMVRMHVADVLDDILGVDPSRAQQLDEAMKIVADAGRGAVVIMRDMSEDAVSIRLQGEEARNPRALRQYGVGAQILAALGIRDMELLTNSGKPKVVGLEGYGLNIVSTHPIPTGK